MDSLVVVIAGHAGYIGRLVINYLNHARLEHHTIPSFRDLTPGEIDSGTPEGKVILINCSGSTLRQDPQLNHNVYLNNTESLRKLIEAFADRLDSVLHMSTTHLDSPEILNSYTNSKKYSESYLNEMAAKYSFAAVNLRLPTIWSSKFLKKDSLLSDITTTNFEELNRLIRFPEAIVQIATQESMGIQVARFLGKEVDKVGFDDSNSWTGNIGGLINLLISGEEPSSTTEIELKRIFLHWKSQKINS